jgi:8-amino-7-oxononanoate synthase
MTGPPITNATATTVTIRGRTLISFAGCNYLGLAQHPSVLAAAADTITQFGLSTSASRQTSGHTKLHRALELEIARTLAVNDALLLPDGYIANLAAAQALAQCGIRHAIIDERAHQSLHDAATLAGLEIFTYETANADDAARAADGLAHDQCAILTDGVFTTDGRIAPLPALLELDTALLVDDCHGFGIVGPNGAGTTALHDLAGHPSIIITSTLAKGIGCAGGFVAASRPFVDTARQYASAYICTTPASPPLVAAARASLKIARTDTKRRERLTANIQTVRRILDSLGIPVHNNNTPIFAFTPAGNLNAISNALDAAGVFVPLMSYPHGPSPRYFRLAVSSEHTPEDLAALTDALINAHQLA